MIRKSLLTAVKKTIYEIEPSAVIVLFGSQSRGDYEHESDWDFLILVDGLVDEDRIDRIRHRLYELEWETGEVISSIVRNREQWDSYPNTSSPFYNNIRREGKAL
ncbi:MAG: nucleotidyltransferase domain-containing protein [Deltaproteobacteria bacterium]|nr:nucleotidyltransferase domain-containing protein [Deltaproteobacteria bacterium]